MIWFIFIENFNLFDFNPFTPPSWNTNNPKTAWFYFIYE